MKQVTIVLERDDDGWWVASAREVPGCHSQGRSISQARRRFLDALGLFVAKPDKVTLVEDIRLPVVARRAVDASTQARADADEAARRAHVSTTDAARLLSGDLAMSVRDVSELLGLSHQRVQQLLRPTQLRGRPPRPVARTRRATGV